MSKISREAYNAFASRKKYKNSNTRVEIEGEEAKMFLFDNLIAYTKDGETFISDGGYGVSNTTRDRLNAFPEIWVSHRKGQWKVGKERINWDGNWTNINLLEECNYI